MDSTVVVWHWRKWAASHRLNVEDILGCRVGGALSIRCGSSSRYGPELEAAARWFGESETEDGDGVVRVPGAGPLLGQLPGERWAVVTPATVPLTRRRFGFAGLPLPDLMVTSELVTKRASRIQRAARRGRRSWGYGRRSVW